MMMVDWHNFDDFILENICFTFLVDEKMIFLLLKFLGIYIDLAKMLKWIYKLIKGKTNTECLGKVLGHHIGTGTHVSL